MTNQRTCELLADIAEVAGWGLSPNQLEAIANAVNIIEAA